MQRDAEQQYLALLQETLDHGDHRVDRTGVGALSLFGAMMRMDGGAHAPILTTKRVFWKTAIREMLWFLTGGTNIRPLLSDNVRIWTDWPLAHYRRQTGEAITQPAFEARILGDEDFARRWGELGPVYGKQWRRWLGPDGREHDQVAGVITALRTNPSSRRMLFHAWNVGELATMALPPCHMTYQFHVARNRLSLMMMQRSVDVFLGLPFNLVGAYGLQMMIAQQCDLDLGDLVWVGGDVHVYLNHLTQAREQLAREPNAPPRMRLTRRAASIDDYRIEDFVVDDYAPHAAIAAEVAV